MTERRSAPGAGPPLARHPALAKLAVLIVLTAGAVLLHLSFASPPGSTLFYALTAGLAVVWLVGGLLLPVDLLPEPRLHPARAVAAPIMVGLGLAVIFVLGAVVVRAMPPLDRVLSGVFGFADRGLLPLVLAITVINAIAEELFFRGSLWRLIGARQRYPVSTLIYAVLTIATGNPLLVFAAVVLALVVGRLRQATGGVLAPMLTHATWSVTMLLAVPPLTS